MSGDERYCVTGTTCENFVCKLEGESVRSLAPFKSELA